jgi:hypothetical protein
MKRLAVVSDLHCGSIYGLLPPDFLTFEGVPKLQNAGQKYLWECWLNFCGIVEDFDPHAVIVNGDDVDGLQRKNDGSELSLTNWKDQKDAAIKTLKVLRSVTRKAKWYFTQGTPYHTGHFGDAEEDIAEAMDATAYPSLGTGKLCRETLTLAVDGGVIIEAAHHISTASVYKTTPLEKEMQATWMNVVNNECPLPDLQIRSHVHNYSNVEQGLGRAITTPCWQLQTRYARKKSVHRLMPHIGGVLVEADYQAKKRGTSACQVRREIYKLPPVKIAQL